MLKSALSFDLVNPVVGVALDFMEGIMVFEVTSPSTQTASHPQATKRASHPFCTQTRFAPYCPKYASPSEKHGSV